MAQNFKINFGGIWITSDGTETGRACKLEIRGASAILNAVIGNTTDANDGQPFNESPLTPTGGGRPLEIVISKLSTGVYDDLKALLDAAALADPPDDEFNITAAGEPGSFDVDVIPFLNPQYLDFGLFIDGNVKTVTIRVKTTAINAI